MIALGGYRGPAPPAYAAHHNAGGPLTTPTYDGSGQSVHPDVFDAGVGNTVHGHRHWMCHTPYPSANDDYENPSVLVSADGLTWTTPAGVTNPLVAFPGGAAHHADGDLVVEPNGTMHITYLYVDGSTSEIRLISSSDGWQTVSTPVTLLTSTTIGFTSQTVIRVGASDWRMWLTDYKASPNTFLYYTASAIAGPWSAPTTLTVNGVPSGRDLWHSDIVPDPFDGTWHGLFCLSDSGVNGGNTANHLARSSDGLTWTLGPLVLRNATGGFDNTHAYRGSIIVGGGVYRTWYSGAAGTTWRIAYTTIPRLLAPLL